MEETKPYLSVVMIARNDNFEGNAFGRLQISVDNFILQAKKYNLNAELIIVDWNPPEDRPLLKDALLLTNDLGPLVIRFIVIPYQIHKKIHKIYKYSDKINIVYPAALNVGIRRAKGEFVWPTNADLLFSNELIRFLSLERLEKDRFYRAFRYDVDRNVLKCNSLKERMDFCENNIVQVLQKNTVSIHGLADHPILQTSIGGDFVVSSKEHWDKLKGFPELNNLGRFADWLSCYMLHLSGLKEEMLPDLMRVYHIDHKRHQKCREEFSKGIINHLRYKIFPQLDDDNKLKILAKKTNNLKNKTSDFFVNIFYSYAVPIIKKFSPSGSWDFNLKYLHWEFHKVLLDMLKRKRSYIYNDDNWGMPNENFAEFVIKNQS